jgi:hypothetical protein
MAPAGSVVEEDPGDDVGVVVGGEVTSEVESPPGGDSIVPQAAVPSPKARTSSAARDMKTVEWRDTAGPPPHRYTHRTYFTKGRVPLWAIVHGMIRTIAIVLDLAIGVAAVAGGIYLLAGARDLSREWLRGTPFKTFFWPGLVLLVLVGGSLLAAAGLLIAQAHAGRLVSVEAGVILLGWTGVVLTTAGYRHWLQLLSVALGIAVVALSFALPAPG